MPISRDDVAYLVEEVFRGKSVVSGLSTRLALVRWTRPAEGFKIDTSYEKEGQKTSRLTLSDLVLMTKEEASKHEKLVLQGSARPESVYDAGVLGRVKSRHDQEKAYDRYR
jgi:tRNA threonylcarbamoyladenosine dehydratase